MRTFELIETKNGVIEGIKLSSGELFETWQAFRDYCLVTKDKVYGEGLHQLVVGLKAAGERPYLDSTQRGGLVIKIRYKKLAMVDVTQWKLDIKADQRSVDLLQKLMDANGEVTASPAAAVKNSFIKVMGFEAPDQRRRNAPSLLDTYLCSSRLPGRQFKPAYVGGMLHSPADRKRVYEGIRSFDISSSYPWSALAAEVPMTASIELTEKQVSNLQVKNGEVEVGEKTGFIGLFRLTNFRRKDWVKFPTLKADDAKFVAQLVTDEYGILSGSMDVALTPYELRVINLQFDVEKIEIKSMSIHGIGKIPAKAGVFLRDSFKKKADLPKGDPNRDAAKAVLNTVVGFWGVDPFNSMVTSTIDPESGLMVESYKGMILDAHQKYAGTDERYGKVSGSDRVWDIRWAAYVLGHARLRIALTEKACYDAGLEVLYTDTDSIKVTGTPSIIDMVFAKLNEEAAAEYSYRDMGQWIDETDGFDRGVFIGPKVYVLENDEGDRNARAAGVRREEIESSLDHLSLEEIASADQLSFSITRRSLGSLEEPSNFGFSKVYAKRELTVTYGAEF